MSLGTEFHLAAQALPPTVPSRAKRKRPAPFSIRLSDIERDALVIEADGAPLGTYIKAKLTATGVMLPTRRAGLVIEDRKLLGQVLAGLGGSRFASNLNQLAHAANIGSLPITPETESELRETLLAVRQMRDTLLIALGMKPEATPCS